MAAKKTSRQSKARAAAPRGGTSELDKLIAQIAATRGDAARHALELRLLELPRKTLVHDLDRAFAANPKARFIYPSILHTLQRKRVSGVQDALRPLLLDEDKSVRGNAARLVSECRWGDAFLPELRRIVEQEAPQTNSAALIPALEALGSAQGNAAFEVLLALAKLRFKNPWRRGNLLMALAEKRRNDAKPVFEKVAGNAKEHLYVRQAAAVGLARLGDRSALERVRVDLDAQDTAIGTSASIALERIVGTPIAVARPQLQRLARWWDSHRSEVDTRFEKFTASLGGKAAQKKPAKVRAGSALTTSRGPTLYAEYTMNEAVATLGAPQKGAFRCDRAFAVLPKVIAWFVSLGDGAGASRFERPSVLSWQPKKGARHGKDDLLPPDLLRSVRLFIRAGSEGPFLYVGKTELIPQFRCDFETRVQITPTLRRDVWERLGGYWGWKLQVDKEPAVFGTDVELTGRLDAIQRAERADVSLSRYEEDVLHVLFAGDRAFLMYLPQIGEAGMSSRNPGYRGSPNDRIVFRSANGEDTALPTSFTVSKGDALRAIEEFLRAGRPPKCITWHDD